jgi:hypothetical protein
MDRMTLPSAIEPPVAAPVAERYAKCIAASKRVRWDIDHDVLRGRHLDIDGKFLPDGLSRVNELPFLRPAEMRFMSRIQGRTYANMFALVERYIGAVTLQLGRRYWFSDPLALEALVRFTDEELKHQELFRRIQEMAAAVMPPGYVFKARGNQVADAVVGKSTWSLLGFTLDIELMSLAHYRSSIEPDDGLSGLWKDVFLYHWKEESQHAILDEIEWRREDGRLDERQRDHAVDDLVALVGAMDATLHAQARADAEYFTLASSRTFRTAEQAAIRDVILKAYRWQYIVTGVREPRFNEALKSMVTPQQLERFTRAIAPIVEHCAR